MNIYVGLADKNLTIFTRHSSEETKPEWISWDSNGK